MLICTAIAVRLDLVIAYLGKAANTLLLPNLAQASNGRYPHKIP
jgi:hypothetical protein